MALMIPPGMASFTTEGEGRFYRFLEQAAKPDERYLAWYLPDINGREPDFILFSRETGLIVFEVKDWALEQILQADPRLVQLRLGGKTEAKQNPMAQARGYRDELFDRIRDDGRLLSKDAVHLGKPRVPVTYGAVFANINRYEFMKADLDRVIPARSAFFWDDLEPGSPFLSDGSGMRFGEALGRMFPPSFPFSLTPQEFNHLKQVIFPTVKIEFPERPGRGSCEGEAERLRILDHHQEAIARRYDNGHHILFGPSGCGKTLVLVHKAAFLRNYNPAAQRILFVCFNIMLVKYIKRLLANKMVPLGEKGVEVLHFFELCSRILGTPVHYEREQADYYETVVELALEKAAESSPLYDAILVDEGQDFSDGMLKILVAFLNPKTDNLTVALDENQNIYRHSQRWKEIGIHARGRTHRLTNIYRNTAEIRDLAAAFLDEAGTDEGTCGQPNLFGSGLDHRGPLPDIRRCGTAADLADYVASRARMLRDREGYPLSEIAVLYPVKAPAAEPGLSLPHLLEERFSGEGLMSRWASEDYRAKESYDITTDSITISTIHSVKGLDFACVFVVGLDFVEAGVPWDEDQLRRLTYVALTRARYHLIVPYLSENSIIRRLLRCRKIPGPA